MRWLAGIRIGRPALAALACVSTLATVVVIHSGLARTPAQTAALAAIRERRQLVAEAKPIAAAPPAAAPVTAAAAPPSPAAPSPNASSAGAVTAPATTTPVAAAPATVPASAPTTPTTPTTTSATPAPDAGLPHIGHVFLITLSTPTYAAAFGKQAPAPYLRALVARGTLLSQFRSLGHGELADELAMASGQAPNADTSDGCPTFREYPANATANAAGEVAGSGCVYPESALTIGDQVTSDGKAWAAYIAGMGSTACQHPNSGAATGVALPGTEPDYDVLHNPFVFFHSVLDDGDCQSDDQDLSRLPRALARPGRTPRFVDIGADACADGAPVAAPAASSTTTTSTSTTTTSTTATTTTTTSAGTTPPTGCPAGEPSGIAAEDAFLKQWVPTITGSPAYRRNGVLVIAFAGTTPANHPTATGALVLSRYTPRRRRIAAPYGPYGLLRSVEDMLNDTPLAHAARARSFAQAVLSRPGGD